MLPMTASTQHAPSYYAASSAPQPDYPALRVEVVAMCARGAARFFRAHTALETGETRVQRGAAGSAQDRLGVPLGAMAGS